MASGMSGGMTADQMDLYSRQIGAFGMEAMGKLVELRVLLVGMKGVGVETAKNLILAGPKAVYLHDTEPVQICDLGTNFYLREEDVGKPRAASCVKELSTLNPYVEVKVHTGPLQEETWKDFHAIVYTDTTPLDHLIRADAFCRASTPPKAFIYASNMGAFSTVFSDFGPSHSVSDPSGEPLRMSVVESIDKEGVVTVVADRHGLDDEDTVKFEEVCGMTELNDLILPVKRVYVNGKIQPRKFKLSIDITSFAPYEHGGIVTQVNVPKAYSYSSLQDSILHPVCQDEPIPMMTHMDMNKMLMKNQGAQLHFARLALWAFQAREGRLPALHNLQDAETCVRLASEVLERHGREGGLTVDELDTEIVRKVALYAATELTGFCAFLGGIVAQEVVKLSGKFLPLRQWLHHDELALVQPTPPKDATPVGSRYDWQISLFGAAFQERMFEQSWFLVGAGALGCEYIKGIALMGVGARRGNITFTDMDRIEVSNLNRQFLFRRENVGMPKSVCAAQAAMRINPELCITTSETPVGYDTEDVFDDAFWQGLSGVWNALDNVKARKYTDGKCVLYEKPLLESGTLGTKANSEVILPHKTTCYNDHTESQEDSIPMCTLRNFPHFIEHCIEWARAQFSEMFEEQAQEVNTLLQGAEGYFAQVKKEGNAAAQLEKMEAVRRFYDAIKDGTDFQACIRLAVLQYTRQFRDRILDLVHALPADSRKVVDGVDLGLFWSGEKRFPQAATSLDSETALDYIVYASNLYAAMFGLQENRDRAAIATMAKQVNVPDWAPKEGLKIDTGDNAGQEMEVDDSGEESAQLEAIKAYFRSEKLDAVSELCVADFEKDDDSNHHIDFITACSNMRAWNYRIKQASRHKCKMIAGKIIPALATTTAMITGLVELELCKLVQGLPMEQFANSNVNLAVNQFQNFEPLPPRKAKAEMDPIMFTEVTPLPDGFTVWDKVLVKQGDLTVAQFIEALGKQHFGIKTELLYKYGLTQKEIDEGSGKPLYNSNPYLPKSQKEANVKRLQQNLKEAYVELYGPLPSAKSTFLLLDGDFKDAKGNDVKVPRVVYYFV